MTGQELPAALHRHELDLLPRMRGNPWRHPDGQHSWPQLGVDYFDTMMGARHPLGDRGQAHVMPGHHSHQCPHLHEIRNLASRYLHSQRAEPITMLGCAQ
ncbi:hypothetical protein ASJ79_18890 [Mycobacterium sp. NAZ190054]|nr:hypothetical protein ASJ79_18890 [Mycobacterium sp. NAZ190054]